MGWEWVDYTCSWHYKEPKCVAPALNNYKFIQEASPFNTKHWFFFFPEERPFRRCKVQFSLSSEWNSVEAQECAAVKFCAGRFLPCVRSSVLPARLWLTADTSKPRDCLPPIQPSTITCRGNNTRCLLQHLGDLWVLVGSNFGKSYDTVNRKGPKIQPEIARKKKVFSAVEENGRKMSNEVWEEWLWVMELGL